MDSRLRLASGTIEVVKLPPLNVAVSAFVVPEVAPGIIVLNSPLPQLCAICQLPLVAPEYQVLLPANAARLAPKAESTMSENRIHRSTICCWRKCAKAMP